MAEVKGYCVKCKKKQIMEGAKEVTLKNKRKAVTGKCPKCGTKMFKIGGMK
jgi:RNase P subunit RPR2